MNSICWWSDDQVKVCEIDIRVLLSWPYFDQYDRFRCWWGSEVDARRSAEV